MSQDGEISKPSRMRAQPDDPFLGVYVLTEFIFCPRAGTIAHETGQDESAEDLGPVKLDYMPEYDLHEIERALQELKGQLWLWGISVVAALFLTGVVTYTVHPESLWIGLAVVAGIAYKLMRLFSAPGSWRVGSGLACTPSRKNLIRRQPKSSRSIGGS